jgi:hypothetical protein
MIERARSVTAEDGPNRGRLARGQFRHRSGRRSMTAVATCFPEQTKPRTIVGEPYFPGRTITLCLYYLGNLPVGVGRGELVFMHGSIVT